jgi:hypothetical protein
MQGNGFSSLIEAIILENKTIKTLVHTLISSQEFSVICADELAGMHG